MIEQLIAEAIECDFKVALETKDWMWIPVPSM